MGMSPRANLYENLRIDLSEIDAKLISVIDSDQDLPRPSIVYDSVSRLIQAGGKRLRPVMAVVGGRFGHFKRYEYVMRTAVLLEYLHMASLIHDDIIDNSELRRGEPTLHKLIGVNSAIHVANYMMARVVEWSSLNEREEHIEEEAYRCAEIAAVITELCIGEFQQLDTRFNFDLTLEQYFDKTRRKTAVLMAECLKAGAKAAHAELSVSELLYRFGETLGMAFQIRDDVLDFTQPQEAIGKPAGADLRNGNITLPVIYALEDPQLAPLIRSLGPHSSDSEMQEAINQIKSTDAIERTLAVARGYADSAMRLIAPLESHPAYTDLLILAEYFLQ